MNKSENQKGRKNSLDARSHITVGRDNEKSQQVAERHSGSLRILFRESKTHDSQDESKRVSKGRRRLRGEGPDSSGEDKTQVTANNVIETTGEGKQWGDKNGSREKAQSISPARKSFVEAITSEKSYNIIKPHSVESPHQRNDLKLTKSVYRKIHINEILKAHAQKVEIKTSGLCVQVKEAAPQGNEGPVTKAGSRQNAANDKEVTEKKKEPIGKVRKVAEPEKSKTNDREGIVKAQEENADAKKTNSGKKEKREDEVKATDAGPKPKEVTVANLRDANAKRKVEECQQEADVQHPGMPNAVEPKEKRKTYTDRLWLVKSAGKNETREGGNSDGEERKKFEDTKMPLCNVNSTDDSGSNENDGKNLSPAVTVLGTPTSEAIVKPRASRSAELRDLVTQAIREHKIFCIFDNHWYIVRPVREELLNRGWLEVIPDRRLIPRRRPPPAGPAVEKEKIPVDRNCNTIEAILAAKELFANELEETVTKSVTLKTSLDKSKMSLVPVIPTRKVSDLSVRESNSLFRIAPPTSEKKRSNFEIREFVTKCQTQVQQNSEKITKTKKEKSSGKLAKKAKEKPEGGKNSKTKSEEKPTVSEPTPLASGLQTMLETMANDKKSIRQAIVEKNVKEGREILALTQSPTESAKDIKEEEKRVAMPESSKVSFKEGDAKTISKIIQSTNTKIHFMWLSIKPAIHLKCFNYSPEIINKFQKTSFCTKIGLWNHLNNIQWYANEVNFPAKSPRMYNTGEADDLQAFFQDFQLTACLGMLKWLADTFFDKGIKAIQTKKGKVPLRAFEFAIKQCERYMKFKENEDLSAVDEPKALQEEWNTFLQWFYTITNDHGKLQEGSSAQVMVVYTKAVETLRVMKKHWPEIDIDGRLNMWIMKPYCASCGRGIFMTNNVYYIGQHSKYIVQKYIEKPFLIYNTKFDIRQWFMITKLTPLEIWMYKECYLRFCTQPFALRNLHESVHLSNNSVQRKYVNRYDTSLTDQNMWDSETFQTYLTTIGHPNVWNEVIYPGMKDAIVSVMLSAQDTFDGPRRSWFEVYGADFMLSSNVRDGPWLIEINENPAMDPSTKVTARLCPQMLRDVIKVVVDKRANKNASTGQWELIYRQNYSPSFVTVDLDVKGRKIGRVPTSNKTELSSLSTPSSYEVIKSLNVIGPEGEKSYREAVNLDLPNRKPDPLLLLKKEHEKFRQRCEVNNAKAIIDRVIENDCGKSLRMPKNLSVRSCNEAPPASKSKATKNWSKDDIGRSSVRGHQDRTEALNMGYAKLRHEINEEDKLKFAKYYKF